jgi:hypothetical protein
VNGSYDTYAFEYFRSGKLIGEERFVDELLQDGPRGYERLPVELTRAFSLEEWESVVTLADIAHRPASDSPNP